MRPLGFAAAAIGVGALLGSLLAQGPAPNPPTRAVRDEVTRTIDRLVIAVNERNKEAIQAVTTTGFTASGDRWAFDRNGYPRWAPYKEDLPNARIAVLVRSFSSIQEDVAFAEGFFRTSGLPTDLAGDFNALLVKRQGAWLVSKARFSPARFEAPYTFPAVTSTVPRSSAAAGSATLFDGRSIDAFCSMDGARPSPVWGRAEDTLKLSPRRPGGTGGIRTCATYSSFDLEFEWKLPPKGNSGIKYGLFYLTADDAAGYEYQLADDAGEPGAIEDPRQRAGALYLQVAPRLAVAHAAGEWNKSRIVVRGRHIEHWLNGEKVVDFETNAECRESPIVIQNHGTEAWFRNLRIQPL